jgi:hypothetical protein
MNKFDLSKVKGVVKLIAGWTHKHEPEILIGIGIAGMGSAVVAAVAATPKAILLEEEAKEELGKSELTTVETVKATWKCYVPAAVMFAASTACIIGGTRVSLRRGAAFAAAYEISKTALDEYTEQVIEEVGEKKEHEIREKVAEKRAHNTPMDSTGNIIIMNDCNTRFMAPITNQRFYSTIEKVRKAVNDANLRMRNSDYVSLNDLYDFLSDASSTPVEHCELGYEIGWNLDSNDIDLAYRAIIDNDGAPTIVLECQLAPKYNFDKYV